jgi:methionine sulfoxide reductase heme-binding subunit
MSPTLLRVIKPLVFAACALPALVLLCGALQLAGADLGTNPIETIQDTCGQWGLRLLVVTLAITPLRDWLGSVWLISLRRMLGLYAFFYVLLHFLAWLILDQDLYWPGILSDISKRPFITIGFLALLLLLPLAVTSTNGMMRRLGRRWKTLHRLIYPTSLLAIWHYYWQVKADVREPLVYLAIVAVLLGWRWWKRRRKPAAEAKQRVANAS